MATDLGLHTSRTNFGWHTGFIYCKEPFVSTEYECRIAPLVYDSIYFYRHKLTKAQRGKYKMFEKNEAKSSKKIPP